MNGVEKGVPELLPAIGENDVFSGRDLHEQVAIPDLRFRICRAYDYVSYGEFTVWQLADANPVRQENLDIRALRGEGQRARESRRPR